MKSSQPVMSIEPFPGGRVVHHLKGGRPHITIQVSGDVLAAALRQLGFKPPEPRRPRRRISATRIEPVIGVKVRSHSCR